MNPAPRTDYTGRCRRLVRTQLAMVTLATTLLAGCSPLPMFTPEAGAAARGPVLLEGAYGPLSLPQSRAILGRLKESGEATDTFRRHLALEEAITDAPLMAGNKVTLLPDGASTYTAMLAAIGSATDSINMETYIIDDDVIGREFMAALHERQRAGVQVNLIYDGFGTFATSAAFFQPLIEAGSNVLEFNPVSPFSLRKGWNLNHRDHRKLLVVDGQVAFIGGINISSVYSSGSFRLRRKKIEPATAPPWRDTHLRVEGPATAEFQKLFISTWEQQHGRRLASRNYFPQLAQQGADVVRAIGSTPKQPYSLIYATLLLAIDHADTRVWLTNAYFVPDPRLLAALKNAAARGVDVQLLLPGKSDSALVYHASRSFYDEMLAAGIGIHEHQQAMLHAKTAVIDGVWTTIGSTNLDRRSLLHNQEVDAMVLGPAFGAQMETLFTADLAKSRPILLPQWQQRSLGNRIREFGARLLAGML